VSRAAESRIRLEFPVFLKENVDVLSRKATSAFFLSGTICPRR